jgi:hypothetical protein
MYCHTMRTAGVDSVIRVPRYELEAQTPRDEAQIARLKKQFGAWHGISSLLNLGTLVCAVSHGWWLARHIAFPAGSFVTAKSFGL